MLFISCAVLAITLSIFLNSADQTLGANHVYNFDITAEENLNENWNSINGDWGIQNDKSYSPNNSLKITDSPDRARTLVRSQQYNDVTITAKVFISSKTDRPGLILRSNQDGTHYYRLNLHNSTLYIQRQNGVQSTTLTYIKYNFPSVQAWYNLTFTASGADLKGKIWRASDPEPNNWTVSVTDDTFISGQVGLFANLTPLLWFDDVSINGIDISQPTPTSIPTPTSSLPEITTIKDVTYKSTLDNLDLKMDISYNSKKTNAPIMLLLHGYTGPFADVTIIERFAEKGMFLIKTSRRGQGNSQGVPDDSGREIYDFYDAIEFVKKNYSAYVDETNINVVGYSGGGGNAYGLVTKFPDYFNTAQIYFGMSDYGYDDTYGWWNNGGTVYRPMMQSRIGGIPAQARNNYQSRAFYLAARNNPYSHIQLFYDIDEKVCPVSHASRYLNAANAANLTNVVSRISNSSTTTQELNETFTDKPTGWTYVGAGQNTTSYAPDGSINWSTIREETMNGISKKLQSLRTYEKKDRIKYAFDFKITQADPSSVTLFSLKNDKEDTYKNSITAMIMANGARLNAYIRAEYNNTPLTAENRVIKNFTTALALNRTYRMEVELNNGVVTGKLMDTDSHVIETQTITIDTSSFTGVNSFALTNYYGFANSPLKMTGTVDNIVVTAWARWIHGHPSDKSVAAGNITAENYFIPDILAKKNPQPTLASSGSMYIPGFIKTEKFFLMLDNGTNHAANMTYNISGDGSTISQSKTFTVEPLTGTTSLTLKLFDLSPQTSYFIKRTHAVSGTSEISEEMADSFGTLTFVHSLENKYTYEIYEH